MKRHYLSIVLFVLFFLSCSSERNLHITFGGIPVDGNLDEVLNIAKGMNSNFLTDQLTDNLELQIISVSGESFTCSHHGRSTSPDNLWFEVFPNENPFNHNVCALEARSVLSMNYFYLLFQSICESLGSPSYNQETYNEDFIKTLDDLDPLAYLEPEGLEFHIWEQPNGYISLQLYKKRDDGSYYVIMNIVDKVNFSQYLKVQHQ